MPVLALRQATEKSTLRVALGCALAVAAVMAWTPAWAGDDGDDTAPDVKFLRNILQDIGLQRADLDSNGINYHERSPLVIPPSRTLPPPEKATAGANPNWPIDPEVKRAKALKAARRAKGMSDTAEMEREANPLRPNELERGPKVNSARDAGAMSPEDSAKPFSPSQLGYKGGLFDSLIGKGDEKTAQFVGEPPRASLTDPPAGYQTPSPNEPYAVGKEVSRPKAFDYYTDRGTGND